METIAPPERSPWVVLTSTSLAVFAVFLDTTILFVAFPSIREDFDTVSPSSLSWVLNAYTIIFAALLIPAGRLADRIGRRKMFLAGVIIFTVASMSCGLAPTVPLLVLARIAQAVGAAALVPSSLALVLQTFPREKIPVAVAIWGAIGAAAGAAGPTLGALVVENLSWRWAFFVNLPVGLVSFFLGRRVLPEGREANPGALPDPLSIGLLAVGMALAAYGIVQAEDWGWGSAKFAGTIAAAAALVVLFVLRCRRVSNPLLDLGLFRARNFRWANGATLVYSIGFNAMFLGNVLFLTQVWRYSVLRAGLAISVGPAIVAVTAPFFGKLAGRIGQRALLIPGGMVWAAGGVYLLSRATVSPDYLGVYLPTVCMTGLGVALVLPQMSSAAVQGLPPDSYGAGSAVNQAIRNLGGTFGVALVVAFTADLASGDPLDSFHRVWWVLVVSGVAVTLFATRLARRPAAASGTVASSPVAAAAASH